MKLEIGDTAPAFKTPDQDGTERTLAEFAGKTVLLYFYPKDDTPGCTVEACSIRDNWGAFKKAGVVVLGVSVDTVKKHKKFADKYELPFTLLADEEKEIVGAYGVWGKKKFMGREFMGTKRWSFLIGPDGKIANIYEDVKPSEHAAQVLADAKSL
ncbi:thioredoxin-dependent thiol peroxidase [bacterium]|nr:thioredoxin-dependent thiol peroxidase [bacterium]